MASIYKRLSSNNEPGGQIAANVNVTSSVLPFGAATSANQTTEINLLGSIDSEAAAANVTLLSIDSHVDGVETLLTDINNKLGSTTNIFTYNEVSSVPSSTLTSIVTYTATQACNLKQVDVSGTNIAVYTVLVNGGVVDKAYTNFGSSLNYSFLFSNGLQVFIGDVIVAKVEHFRPYTGDFNGKIIIGVI